MQINCESGDSGPEVWQANTPLHWLRNSQALNAYKIAGTPGGSNFFELGSWETGQGGVWQDWWVDNGEFFSSAGAPLDCAPLISSPGPRFEKEQVKIFPNPVTGSYLNIHSSGYPLVSITIVDLTGRLVLSARLNNSLEQSLSLGHLKKGVYLLRIKTIQKNIIHQKVIEMK